MKIEIIQDIGQIIISLANIIHLLHFIHVYPNTTKIGMALIIILTRIF